MHTLSAMTAGIRRNWIQAVMKNVRPSTAPDVARSVQSCRHYCTHFSTIMMIQPGCPLGASLFRHIKAVCTSLSYKVVLLTFFLFYRHVEKNICILFMIDMATDTVSVLDLF